MLTIVLRPTFYQLDSPEFEFGNLPKLVQAEVISYFQSNEFLQNSIPKYISGECYLSYPAYNIKILRVSFQLKDLTLMVILLGELIKIPTQGLISEKLSVGGLPINPKLCYIPVTWKLLDEYIREDFHKASNDGEMITHYGYFLGKNGYQIRLNYDRTQVIPM